MPNSGHHTRRARWPVPEPLTEPMTLYLLRHAIAAERGTPGYTDDSKRPLTSKGAKKMKRIAQGMKTLGIEFDLLLSSPYARARQTAEIVAAVFHTKKKLCFSEHLTVEGDPVKLIYQLTHKHRSAVNVILVGHEPYLSSLASVLLTGQEELPLTFKKGGLCKLAVRRLLLAQCATLEWLLTPRVLAAVGE